MAPLEPPIAPPLLDDELLDDDMPSLVEVAAAGADAAGAVV